MRYVACCLLLAFLSPALMAQTLPDTDGFVGAYVEGNVAGGDTGKPLVGAKIDVIGAKVSKTGVRANSGCGAGFAMSAANGNFSVGVGQNNKCVDKKHPINGKYYVSVSKRGYLPQQKFIDFGTQRTNVIGSLTFRLDPAHASIQGQVVGPDGKGLPYAYAWLMKDPFAMVMQPPKGHSLPLYSELPMVRADGNGKFNIPVSPGNYVVLAGKAGYELVTKTVDSFAQQVYQRMAANPYLPPQTRAKLGAMNQPQLGVHVSVATDGIASAHLAMVKASPTAVPPGTMKQPKFRPFKIVLAGQARSSPNNVLFFVSQAPGGSENGSVALGIVRTTTLLGTGKIDPARVTSLNFLQYGYPGEVGCRHRPGHFNNDSWSFFCEDPVLSFTDPTAKPGTAYYYYIVEGAPYGIGPGGTSNLMQSGTPYSNGVQIVTQGERMP